jgi:hypothetical protein
MWSVFRQMSAWTLYHRLHLPLSCHTTRLSLLSSLLLLAFGLSPRPQLTPFCLVLLVLLVLVLVLLLLLLLTPLRILLLFIPLLPLFPSTRPSQLRPP